MKQWKKYSAGIGFTGAAFFLFLSLGLSLFGGELKATDRDFSTLYRQLLPSLVSIEDPSAVDGSHRFLASGVIVSGDGYVLTSESVTRGRQRLSVVNRTIRMHLPAEVVGRDRENDLALLRVKSKEPLSPVVFENKDALNAGETALIVAERERETIRSALVVSSGEKGLRLDRAMVSSGALITDTNGKPLGLVNGKQSRNAPMLTSLKTGQIVAVMNRLMKEDRILRAYFGMTAEDLSPNLYGFYGINRGVLVTALESNASAEQAGLMRGDLIVGVGAKPVIDKRGLVSLVSGYDQEDNVTIHYVRNALNKSLQMRLSRINQELLNPNAFWYKGMVLEEVSKEWAGIFKIPGYLKGVVVTLVEPGSPAQLGGIHQGDVIFQLDSKSITGLKDFKLHANRSKKERVFIFRDGWNFIKLF